MRLLLVLVIVAPIVVAAYFLSRGPWPEPAGQRAARLDVDSITHERLEALGRGDVEGWGRALRADAMVVSWNHRQVSIGPEVAIQGMKGDSGHAARGARIHGSGSPRVITGASRRGRLAWAVSVADPAGRDPALGHSVAYLLRDDEWRVVIETLAESFSWEELQAGAVAGRFPSPAALDPVEGRGAERLAKRFRRSLAHYGRTRPERQAIAIGPAPGEPARGDSAVGVMLAEWERRLGPPRLAAEGLRVVAPRRTGVGWVVANLEVTPPGWGGATLPLRFTGVYRSRGEDSWGLALAHLSVVAPAAGAVAEARRR